MLWCQKVRENPNCCCTGAACKKIQQALGAYPLRRPQTAPLHLHPVTPYSEQVVSVATEQLAMYSSLSVNHPSHLLGPPPLCLHVLGTRLCSLELALRVPFAAPPSAEIQHTTRLSYLVFSSISWVGEVPCSSHQHLPGHLHHTQL